MLRSSIKSIIILCKSNKIRYKSTLPSEWMGSFRGFGVENPIAATGFAGSCVTSVINMRCFPKTTNNAHNPRKQQSKYADDAVNAEAIHKWVPPV